MFADKEQGKFIITLIKSLDSWGHINHISVYNLNKFYFTIIILKHVQTVYVTNLFFTFTDRQNNFLTLNPEFEQP